MKTGGMFVIFILGILSGALLTARAIPILKHKQLGQNIRTEGPQSHLDKAGTPSMGGVAIILATVSVAVISAITAGHYDRNTFVILGSFVAFGLIGFADDYLKVIKKQNEGLLPWQKFSLQFILSLLSAVYMVKFSGALPSLYIPFIKEWIIVHSQVGEIGLILFLMFTIIAMSNGVNLTDGLDGLAGGITAIVSIFMAFVAMTFAQFAQIPAAVFFTALSGACIGFLIFNKNPAKIFMGDTGSLSIGGGMAVAGCMMSMEIFLPVVGIIYVLEALSVVLQVMYFKGTGGKRLFRMAPLHHHFEEGGMEEVSVVNIFWGITLIITVISLILG